MHQGNKDAFNKLKKCLDVLLVTPYADLPWEDYVETLKVGGVLCLVGIPPSGEIKLPVKPFVYRRISYTGSLSGGTKSTKEMLAMAAKYGIRAKAELFPLSSAGVNEALEKVGNNDVTLRAVLVCESELEDIRKEIESEEKKHF